MEAILKKELKEWQRSFRAKHGREPTRADMAKHPDISSTYDTWHAIKNATADESKSRPDDHKGKSKSSSNTSVSISSFSRAKESSSRSSPSTIPASSFNPFKTPTKPKASQTFKTPTTRTINDDFQSQSAKDPFRTPSRSTPNQQRTTPRSIIKANMPSPSPQSKRIGNTVTPPSNASRFYSKASPTQINSPARLRAAIASHATTSPNRMGPAYTPRTKARKRLRGEEVPPTPSGMSSRPAKKRFGTGTLATTNSSTDALEGLVVKSDERYIARGAASGAFKIGLAERKVSNGKAAMNAMLENKGRGKGKGKGKASEIFSPSKRLVDEEEDVLEASPVRSTSGKEAEKRFKPLFGGQDLFNSQSADKEASKATSPESEQLKDQTMDFEMEMGESSAMGTKSPLSSGSGSVGTSTSNSRPRSSSPTHSTSGTTPIDEVMTAASDRFLESETGISKATQSVLRMYTTEISDDEGAEVEAKKAWDAVRSRKHKGKTTIPFRDPALDGEMSISKQASRSQKTTIVIRPYQRNGNLDHRTHSNSSTNTWNSSISNLEGSRSHQDDDEDEVHYGILDYNRRNVGSSRSPKTRVSISPLPNNLAGLSLASPLAKAQRARMSEKISQRAHLKSVLGDDDAPDLYDLETKALEAEIESNQAYRLEHSRNMHVQGEEKGVDEGEGKRITWGEAKANAKDKDSQNGKGKGKGRGKPNSHKTRKEREEEQKQEKEKQIKRGLQKAREQEKKSGLIFSRAGRSGVGDDEDSERKRTLLDETSDSDPDLSDESEREEHGVEHSEDDEEAEQLDPGQTKGHDQDEESQESRLPRQGQRTTRRKRKKKIHLESDEDWASEVSSDEYGLGDGMMDNDDVL